MPGLRMQCVEFLTFIALGAGALINSKDTCACMCSEFDVCNIVNEQDARIVKNEKNITYYGDTVNAAQKFFGNGKERYISDVVEKLVEENINSVLKKAVTDLGIPSGNPEGSSETNEESDEDSALERTRDYLTHIFKAMKHFSSKLKETTNQTQRLRNEHQGVVDERKKLLSELEEVEKLSQEQKKKISEMPTRLKELEDKFTLYKDITEIQKTLANLRPEINGANGNASSPNGGKCTDGAYPALCKQIVEAKFCKKEYYSKICCASCTKAGQ